MNLSTTKLGLLFAIFGCIAATLNAELLFTEQAVVTELSLGPEHISSHDIALGDALTITYRIKYPSPDPFGDPDSVVYDHVNANVSYKGESVYSTSNAELTVWNLVGFYGVTITDWSAPFLDYLASNSPAVIDQGFLVSGIPLAEFDSASSGSLFVDDTVIGFSTTSYTLTGQPPLSSVPEAATFGIGAATLLLGLVARAFFSRTTLGLRNGSESSSMH